MLEFIKMFGMGIIYTVLFPIILILFLLFVVYTVFNYLVCEAIYFGGFFLGRKFDDTTKLEKKLIKLKEEKETPQVEEVKEVENEEGDLNA